MPTALLVQLNPRFKDVAANIEAARQMLSTYSRSDAIDMVVFPEMAMTGYCFSSAEEVRGFAEEDDGVGLTTRFCKEEAIRLGATVFCGYPRLTERGTEKERMFNAMLVCGPDGEVLERYNKHFLYDVDKVWASEGEGFKAITLPHLGNLKVGLGICMDINPYEFRANFGAFEFASFMKAEQVDVIVFCSNWCSAHPSDSEDRRFAPINMEETLEYWVVRMSPLLETRVSFLCADRIGSENGVQFCGCSCAINLQDIRVSSLIPPYTEGCALAHF